MVRCQKYKQNVDPGDPIRSNEHGDKKYRNHDNQHKVSAEYGRIAYKQGFRTAMNIMKK